MTQLHGKCYDPRQLQLLLNDQLDPQSEADVLDHMNHCPACQAALESLAAGEELWEELSDNLTAEPASNTDELMETTDHPQTELDTNIQELLKNIGPTDHPDMLGRIGTYEICGVVGRGSTGIVLKSFESSLNRYVAIKVLSPVLSGNGAARRRFEREARAIAAVVNEHVVPIFAVDEHHGLPYFVMQYVSGASLQHRIERQGPFDPCEVVRISMQIATGLAAAHAQGIVHRDIKPANILLEHGLDRVMVSDFGLARVTDGATVTMSGMITGTPSYMAPEQARGDQIDQRSDLFSLGSVMYTMCTARTPFPAETVYGTIRRICEAEPRSIRESNPEIPEWLESFIMKLLAKNKEDRFESAEQVAAVLSHELAHLQNPTLVQAPPRDWAASIEKPELPMTKAGRSVVKATLLVLAASLVMTAVSGFLTNGTSDPQPVAHSPADQEAAEEEIAIPVNSPDEQMQQAEMKTAESSGGNHVDVSEYVKARVAAKMKDSLKKLHLPVVEGHRSDHYADAVAIVYPIEGIKVDGDPSDWPADLKSYPIQRAEVGNPPGSAEDLSANFKIGYSEAEQALYVLVEVNDSSQILDPDAGQYRWDAQDGCELYLDKRHDPKNPLLAQYTRYGESLNAFGSNDGIKGVALIVEQQQAKRYYEWRVDLEDGVAAGKSMGFDLAILDKDRDDSFTWLTWGSGTQKIYSPGNHGNILLVEAGQALGEVTGEARWPQEASHAKKKVRLQSQSSPGLWTAVSCPESGNYRTVLPPGSYSVSVLDDADHRFQQAESVEVTVQADQTVEAKTLEISLLEYRKSMVAWGGGGPVIHADNNLLMSASYADSRNDSIAVAYPISEITIDGDLSDWPENMETYTIGEGKAGAQIKDDSDLQASYRVGYNVDEQALYVAVEVMDDSIVLDENAARDWSGQDGLEIYLDTEHRLHQPHVQQLNFYGKSLQQEDKRVEVASTLQPKGRTFEWRISTDEVISAGRSLGFDVAVLDKDDDESFSWLAWGRGTQKAWHKDRCGNLLLVEPETQFGTVAGNVNWPNSHRSHFPRVAFQSLAHPGFRPRVAPNQDGEYSARLPIGEYIVTPVDHSEAKVRVQVEADESVTADELKLAGNHSYR